MKINSINNQNFGKKLDIYKGIAPRIENGLRELLGHDQQKLSQIPTMIQNIEKSKTIQVKVTPKQGVIQPVNDSDFDIFVSSGITPIKAEAGKTLAESFLNALNKATELLNK